MTAHLNNNSSEKSQYILKQINVQNILIEHNCQYILCNGSELLVSRE